MICAACRRPAQTYEVACATCGGLRWPVLTDPPASGWVCARCRITPAGKRETRVAGARKRRATLAQKAAQTAPDSPGRVAAR